MLIYSGHFSKYYVLGSKIVGTKKLERETSHLNMVGHSGGSLEATFPWHVVLIKGSCPMELDSGSI